MSLWVTLHYLVHVRKLLNNMRYLILTLLLLRLPLTAQVGNVQYVNFGDNVVVSNNVSTNYLGPVDIPNCTAFFDSRTLVGYTNGQAVSVWTNSVAGPNLTNRINFPPLWTNYSVMFMGSQLYTNSTITVTNRSHTLMFVGKSELYTNNQSVFRFQQQSGSYIVFPYRLNSNGYINSFGASLVYNASPLRDNMTNDLSFAMVVVSNGLQQVYLNNVLQSTSGATLSTDALSLPLTVGALDSAGSYTELYRGRLFKVIISGIPVSDATRTNIWNKIKTEYGL